MRIAMALAVLTLLACSEAPTAPQPGTPAAAVFKTQEKIPLIEDRAVSSGCAGETIFMHFRELVVFHEINQDGDRFHVHVTLFDRGSYGVGLTSGAVYRLTGALTDNSFTVDASPQYVQTIHSTLVLAGQGAAPNLLVKGIYRITVTADGTVRVERAPDNEVVCR